MPETIMQSVKHIQENNRVLHNYHFLPDLALVADLESLKIFFHDCH